MSTRRIAFYFSLAFLLLVLAGIPMKSQLTAQNDPPEQVLIAGRNVNMVSGTTLPGGDPWLQRQNEPSIAVSTRNPLHLLAGANDYRTVDMAFSEGNLPGKAQGAMTGDAWVGIYKSFDGGESWTTALIHGFPQDNSEVGKASPLKAFSTAADPIVRAGTNGLFYYSGMAFNRAQEKGGGSIFLTRFIDNNNVEGGDPIKYLDTKIIDQGTSGQFIDMPRIGVDIPRGSGTVTIDGQTIPRSNVYAAYTVFLGNTDVNIRSRIMFRRSTDCGATWGSAIKISESQHIIQGATIAIHPNSGEVYVVFRRFLHPSQTNAIVIMKSTDFGQTFSKPTVIAEINPFDQPATDVLGDDISDPAGPSFRTNSYPTMTVDKDGIVYVAWTERGRGPTGEARIVMSTSQGGTGWTLPAAIINLADPTYQGIQFMPHLTYAQGKLVLVWFDQRYDEYAPLYGVGSWIGDNMPIRHTTDVRCAQANPGLSPSFQESVQVSKYLWALPLGSADYVLEQQQYNPPNFEMFKGGTTPFHGDYIEVTPAPQFVLGPTGWQFNTEASSAPVFHAVWTDNRDVRPPADGNWTNYTPPASVQPGFGSIDCLDTNPSTMGMRNQNIYTSSFVQGVAVASPGNTKTLGDLGNYYDSADGLIPRAFVIYVRNPGYEIKTFRLSIEPEPAGVDASFVEFEDLEELDVMIAPYSTIARTVFVRSSDADASVQVNVVEIDELGGNPVENGLTAAVVLNPDPTSPPYSPGDEYHDPDIPDPNIVNWDELNPNIVNPNIRNYPNPNIRNWDELNPNIVNPNIRNPNIVNPNIRNPNIVNPNIRNISVYNPNIVNPNIRNFTEPEFNGAEVADVVFTIKNEGNTTSTYTLKTYSKEALPDKVYAQLLVYRVHYTPAANYYEEDTGLGACYLHQERHHELLLNVTNPNIRNPNIRNPNIRNPNIRNGGLENATFCVPPGEEVEAILRVIDFAPGANGLFRVMQTGTAFSAAAFAESIGFAATAHAYNTDDARTLPKEVLSYPTSATKLVISTSSLPDGVVNVPYSATLTADGGDTPYFWALNSGELPPGLSLGSGGEISGTPTAAGPYHFIVRVDDSSLEGDFDTQEFSIYIDSDGIPDALTITTTSLPSGVLGYWYGAALEATGGVWPRTWSLAGGSLPPGLGLDSDGVISGTIELEVGQDYPTTYNFSVIVTDNTGYSTAPKALSIYVNLATGEYLTISGMVYDASSNPLDGVVMRGLPNTPITGANGTPGFYEDQVPEFWSGTVEPFKATYSFTPGSRDYSSVGANQTSQDYNAGPVVGPASKLVFTTSPSGGVGGAIWTVQPKVEVQDTDGDRITMDDTTVVTLAMGNNPGNGSLSGPFSMTVTSGEASFAGLSIDKGGWGYTLEAISVPSLTEGTSGTFNIEGFSETKHPLENVMKWQTATPTVLAGADVVLIAGGLSWEATHSLSDICFYNPSTNEFEYPENSMNQARQQHTATSLLAGTVLFVGGDAGGQIAEIFDPATGEFTPVSGTIYPHVGHRATLLQDGRVLVTGNMGTNANSAEVYDPQTGTFEDAGPMNYARNRHTSTLLPNGKVLITGGHDGEGVLNSAELYDPATGVFAEIAGGMAGGNRFNHQATLLDNGMVLLTGGDSSTSNMTAEIYDPTPTETYPNGHFQLIGNMLYGHEMHQAALLRDGTVLIIGGNNSSASNEIYDPLTSEFQPTGPMSTYRFDGASAVLPDGRVLITGGYTEEGVYGPGEVWNPRVPFPTHIISGTITPNGSEADVGGITLVGLPGHPMTNHGGYYEGLVLDGWDGTATPTKPGYTFNPPNIEYSDVSSNISGQDYTVTSAPGMPVKLAFAQQPSNTTVGAPITPAITVEIQDAEGNLVTTAADTVTLTLLNADGAELSGTTSIESDGGIATFDDLSIDTAGMGYQLRAESGSLTEVDSSPFDITSAVGYPEINIEQTIPSGPDIPDGGSFDFGSAAVGSNTYALLTIRNLGTADLTITTPITITGTDSDQFFVEAQPTSPVGSSGSTTFEIRFSPTSGGAKSASISIENNDADENPYDIALNGTATAALPVAAWAKTYGGSNFDYAFPILQTSDGGYIAAGWTSSFGAGGDAWVLKLNGAGVVVWQKTYGGTNNDGADSIQQTSDGGYIVAGYTSSFGESGDAWVLKLDGAGVVVWQKTYGGPNLDYASSIQQTSDGGYIVAGTTYSFGAGGDVWVLKLDGAGVVVWQKTYGGTNEDNTADYGTNSIQQTSDGGYIVAGRTRSFGAGGDVWVLKLDGAGVVGWEKTYGGTDEDYAYSIQQTPDGGYIVAGTTYSFGAGGDAWVLKLDGTGVVVWQKTYGGTNLDYAYSFQQTSDGGYIVAGTTYSFGEGDGDVWVLKLDGAGVVVWQKTYGGTGQDLERSIQQTSDGGYIVAGMTYSFGEGGGDFWVLKLRPDGSIDSSCSPGLGAASTAIPASTSVTPSNSAATVANSAATITGTAVTPANTSAVVQTQCGSASTLQATSSAMPTSGPVPLLVNFTGSATGGAPPYSYSWIFGDGGSSASQNPSHTYSAPGTYSALLTVTDSASQTDVADPIIISPGGAVASQILVETASDGAGTVVLAGPAS